MKCGIDKYANNVPYIYIDRPPIPAHTTFESTQDFYRRMGCYCRDVLKKYYPPSHEILYKTWPEENNFSFFKIKLISGDFISLQIDEFFGWVIVASSEALLREVEAHLKLEPEIPEDVYI